LVPSADAAVRERRPSPTTRCAVAYKPGRFDQGINACGTTRRTGALHGESQARAPHELRAGMIDRHDQGAVVGVDMAPGDGAAEAGGQGLDGGRDWSPGRPHFYWRGALACAPLQAEGDCPT